MIRRAAFALLIGAIAAAGAAELSIYGSNRAEAWAFRKDWQTLLEDKLDLTVRYGDLEAHLAGLLFEPSKPWDAVRKPMRLADFSVGYDPGPVEVTYGKFFQGFGKGLALRTYSDEEFRHYKSLHGLRGSARLPLATELVLVGGRMRDVFFQENTYKIMNVADTTDQVMGGDVSSVPLSWQGSEWTAGNVSAGARYVRVNRNQDPTPRAFTELYGGNAGLALGPAEVYFELCRRLGTKPGVGGRDRGLGWYASASGSLFGVSLVAQAMDYDGLGFPSGIYHYNDPPTPIKSGVALEQDRGMDEQGFGISLAGSPASGLTLEADLGRLFRHDDSSAGVTEWEGKARYSAGSDWTLEGSFNRTYQKNVELGTYQRAVNKPVARVNYLVGEHTFGIEAECGMVSETPGGEEPPTWNYLEPGGAISYGYGPSLLFTLGWQGATMKLDKRYGGETSWPILEAVWSITQRNILRVRVGAERGGYTCSGGVCRYESPFQGAKVQLISRF